MRELINEEDIAKAEFQQNKKEKPIDLDQIQRIQELEREAYENGYEAGRRAGFEMGEKEALILVERLQEAIKNFEELRKKQFAKLEGEILDFSLTLAKKIIMTEITLNPNILANIVKEALKRLQNTGQVKIRIHPSLQAIFQKNEHLLESEAVNIVFELDSKLPLYGAEVIGSDEIILTDIDEQFKNLLEDIGLKGE